MKDVYGIVLKILADQKDVPSIVNSTVMAITCVIVAHRRKDQPLNIKCEGRGFSWNPNTDRGHQAYQMARNELWKVSPFLDRILSKWKFI